MLFRSMIDHLYGRDFVTLYFETDCIEKKRVKEEETRNIFKSRIGITIIPKAVPIGDLPRSEKKTTRIFDNRY